MVHGLQTNLNLIIPYQTMHLIYSVLRPADDPSEKKSEIQIRYHAYLNACEKHKNHIKEIQKYFPNWMPKPPAP